MKAKVQLYKNDGSGEYGFPVKLILSHQRKTRRRTIGYAFLEDWEVNSQLPLPSHDDFEDLYTTILDFRKKAAKMEFRKIKDLDQALEYFEDPNDKIKSFYVYAQSRIDYMIKINREGNGRAYATAIKELQKYSPKLDFNQLNRNFLEGFKNYKKSAGLKNTSVRNYLYEIRAIYNTAVRSGLVEDSRPFAGIFNDIPVIKRRARNHYFNETAIKVLENSSFTQRNYNLSKDLTLLQFYLCGADFMDVCFLKRKQLQNGRVFLKRNKLGDRAYEFDIKLTKKALSIIDKWQDTEEKEYIFSFPKSEVGYRTFRVRMYRCLQMVKKQLDLKLLPQDGTFTLKVMRHSFATLGKFTRIEEDILRELMGHERNDIDTIYKDKYPEKERDAAQMGIIGLSDVASL